MQLMALKNVPGEVFRHIPEFFTFAAVRVGTGYVAQLLPSGGGMVNTVIYAGFAGMTDVAKFVTWDEVKKVDCYASHEAASPPYGA
jgi:hypothetical protein